MKPKHQKAFSLIELMISLIVISIITAAFAPVISKKMKTVQNTSTSSSVISSNSICNSVSKGCVECSGDTCFEASEGYFVNALGKTESCANYGCVNCTSPTSCYGGCQSGYYESAIGGSTCKKCSESLTGCKTCTNVKDGCSVCQDGYYKEGTSCFPCSSAISNCAVCSSKSVCTLCNSEYFTVDGGCWKYECNDLICIISTNNGRTLSFYKYNLGDGGFAIPAGINICYTDSTCPYPATSPICLKARGSVATAGIGCVTNQSSPQHLRQ